MTVIFIFDNACRWGSVFDMVERFLYLKPHLKTNKMKLDLEKTGFNAISKAKWREITEIHKTLKPAKMTTVALQSESLSLNDFFILWVKCYEATKQIRKLFTVDLFLVSFSLLFHHKRIICSRGSPC